MKLLELMIECDIKWPDGAKIAMQDHNKLIKWSESDHVVHGPVGYNGVWSRQGNGCVSSIYFDIDQLADDWKTRIVTREEWQQERDKMQNQQYNSSDIADAAKEFEEIDLRISVYGNNTDNSWHERGEFPPVGCECEVKASKDNWVKAFTVGLDVDGAMVVQFIDSTIPFSSCASPSYFRPLRTEREKAIDEMADDMPARIGRDDCFIVAKMLYDAGYRKEKAK